MQSLVQPNAWVALKLPSETTRVLQVTPHTTISLGKYGSFPSNLIIERPYHLTYELQDKQPGESFSRLRVVPSAELYADVLADEASQTCSTPAEESDGIISAVDGVEFSLVDADSGSVVARSNRVVLDDNARQTLTMEEIEVLKRDGTDAGKDLIAKLMLSHTGLDQKTSFSLAKYKLLKTRKYIRRFQVLPLDLTQFAKHQLEDRDPAKILDLRAEMLGLVGCWGNVHFGGEDRFLDDPKASCEQGEETIPPLDPDLMGGRWLVVDDVSGLLVAAMAERMGILYPEAGDEDKDEDKDEDDTQMPNATRASSKPGVAERQVGGGEEEKEDQSMADFELFQPARPLTSLAQRRPRHRTSDFHVPYSQTNTLTLVHSASQPNLSFLNYYGFDVTNPNHPPHPLLTHLLTLSWLQLINPAVDTTYSTPPPTATADQLASWKPGRRGNFHRKRRRFTRTRHAVDSARAGGFSGLVCASTMDPVGILRHALPLLAGGAAVAIYSPSLEPLTRLADCFSVARRAAWTSGNVPAEITSKTAEELERWEGTEAFPVNPTLLLGTSIQTSRARTWQVLPGRTHPVMTANGGAEGYVFTGWRAKPAEGRIEARGKFKKRKINAYGATESESATPAAS